LTDWDFFVHENMGFYMVLSCFIMNLYIWFFIMAWSCCSSSWFYLWNMRVSTSKQGIKKGAFFNGYACYGNLSSWPTRPGWGNLVVLLFRVYGVQNKRVPAACYWKGVFFPLRI
jgi:hypothetical protein